ncbi:MAG: PQQ-dependent sugar dehydrogenase [Thioalkalivibrio sp.]|nr:MAG: PQQ-dependent sugar dehydrogenase [Thioalkalivibrio sp.]
MLMHSMRTGPWRILPFLLLLASLAACAGEQAHTDASADYRVVPLTGGLSHPWGLAFLPEGDILISERPGRLRIFREGRLLPEPVPGLPQITATGQGGLLDLALHPGFEDNRWLYFTYAAPVGGGVTTRLARARFEDDRLSDVEVLFTAGPASRGGRHFGSRIVFDDDGYVFLSVGDRGDRPRAQDLDDHAGSIVRLHDDGRVPEDNPFVGRDGARPEIYAYGVRNPQGMALHPETGALWEHEHGPRGGDEINIIEAGLNYGWPVITHGIAYSGAVIGEGIREKEGMEQPLYHWTPSIAPSGMAFYRGGAFPGWDGDLLVGALAHRHLARLTLDDDNAVVSEVRMLEAQNRRIRDVRVRDGLIYVLTDHDPGELLRLEPPGQP